jgi:hypothetical protein
VYHWKGSILKIQSSFDKIKGIVQVVTNISIQEVFVLVIRRKADIEKLKERFVEFAEFDGEKHYLAAHDFAHSGTITFMRYEDGRLTVHRKNDRFWDLEELPIDWDELWGYRKSLNSALR